MPQRPATHDRLVERQRRHGAVGFGRAVSQGKRMRVVSLLLSAALVAACGVDATSISPESPLTSASVPPRTPVTSQQPSSTPVSPSPAGRRALRRAGVDLGTGTLHLALHIPRGDWYLTFDRTIAGYAVANAPAGWWLDGDKAYLNLRADGTLVSLYAIQPDHRRVPTILDRTTLDRRLAKVAKVSRATLATYEPGLLWVRAYDPQTGRTFPKLRLSYCATHRWHYGWEAWCVDAGTGALNAQGGGVD